MLTPRAHATCTRSMHTPHAHVTCTCMCMCMCMPHAPCPTPHAPRPMPHAPCPMPGEHALQRRESHRARALHRLHPVRVRVRARVGVGLGLGLESCTACTAGVSK